MKVNIELGFCLMYIGGIQYSRDCVEGDMPPPARGCLRKEAGVVGAHRLRVIFYSEYLPE